MKEHEIRREDEGIPLEVHSASLRWIKGWTKGTRPSMPLAQQWNLRTFGQTQTDGNPPVCPYVEQGTVLEDMSTEASPPKHQLTPQPPRGRASRNGVHALACTRSRAPSVTHAPQLLLPPARCSPLHAAPRTAPAALGEDPPASGPAASQAAASQAASSQHPWRRQQQRYRCCPRPCEKGASACSVKCRGAMRS